MTWLIFFDLLCTRLAPCVTIKHSQLYVCSNKCRPEHITGLGRPLWSIIHLSSEFPVEIKSLNFSQSPPLDSKTLTPLLPSLWSLFKPLPIRKLRSNPCCWTLIREYLLLYFNLVIQYPVPFSSECMLWAALLLKGSLPWGPHERG